MTYALLAWNAILTAFVVLAIIKAREYKTERLEILSKLAVNIVDTENLQDDVTSLRAEFDGKVKDLTEAETEKAKAEARSEALWQEGLNNLLNYGGELLTSEGGYGGK